jgi:hypothetical protein
VIHPMQYELEQAHHANCVRRAVHQRLLSEAEQSAASSTPSAARVPTLVARVRAPALRLAARFSIHALRAA